MKKVIRIIALVCVIIIIFMAVIIGVVQITLNAQKDSEEYKVAYNYLVSSDAFEKLNVDESKIRFNLYSYSRQISSNGKSVIHTAEIGFAVKFRSFNVICHKENGIWQVCDDCTRFE